eukprot:87386-Pyramimonas_sp.AAC.1
MTDEHRKKWSIVNKHHMWWHIAEAATYLNPSAAANCANAGGLEGRSVAPPVAAAALGWGTSQQGDGAGA